MDLFYQVGDVVRLMVIISSSHVQQYGEYPIVKLDPDNCTFPITIKGKDGKLVVVHPDEIQLADAPLNLPAWW
jgi:hypothetical protein